MKLVLSLSAALVAICIATGGGSAEPLSPSDVDVGLVYDLLMPTTVLTTEENTLPNSYSDSDTTFDEVMRVAITPASGDAVIRVRVSPHFFRTDNRVGVYWRVVRKITGQPDVVIADQVPVTRFGSLGEQIVLYDTPNTTSEVVYALEARGRGFSQQQTVTRTTPGGYVSQTCYRTERQTCGTQMIPDPLTGICCVAAPVYCDVRVPYECGYTVPPSTTTTTTTVEVTSSRKCGLRARALIAAEQGADLAVPPLD